MAAIQVKRWSRRTKCNSRDFASVFDKVNNRLSLPDVCSRFMSPTISLSFPGRFRRSYKRLLPRSYTCLTNKRSSQSCSRGTTQLPSSRSTRRCQSLPLRRIAICCHSRSLLCGWQESRGCCCGEPWCLWRCLYKICLLFVR
jgi:hypothetical protein